jgi:hypothetical protein
MDTGGRRSPKDETQIHAKGGSVDEEEEEDNESPTDAVSTLKRKRRQSEHAGCSGDESAGGSGRDSQKKRKKCEPAQRNVTLEAAILALRVYVVSKRVEQPPYPNASRLLDDIREVLQAVGNTAEREEVFTSRGIDEIVSVLLCKTPVCSPSTAYILTLNGTLAYRVNSLCSIGDAYSSANITGGLAILHATKKVIGAEEWVLPHLLRRKEGFALALRCIRVFPNSFENVALTSDANIPGIITNWVMSRDVSYEDAIFLYSVIGRWTVSGVPVVQLYPTDVYFPIEHMLSGTGHIHSGALRVLSQMFSSASDHTKRSPYGGGDRRLLRVAVHATRDLCRVASRSFRSVPFEGQRARVDRIVRVLCSAAEFVCSDLRLGGTTGVCAREGHGPISAVVWALLDAGRNGRLDNGQVTNVIAHLRDIVASAAERNFRLPIDTARNVKDYVVQRVTISQPNTYEACIIAVEVICRSVKISEATLLDICAIRALTKKTRHIPSTITVAVADAISRYLNHDQGSIRATCIVPSSEDAFVAASVLSCCVRGTSEQSEIKCVFDTITACLAASDGPRVELDNSIADMVGILLLAFSLCVPTETLCAMATEVMRIVLCATDDFTAYSVHPILDAIVLVLTDEHTSGAFGRDVVAQCLRVAENIKEQQKKRKSEKTKYEESTKENERRAGGTTKYSWLYGVDKKLARVRKLKAAIKDKHAQNDPLSIASSSASSFA